MAYSYTSLLLQRIAIPIILVLAALFRPVGISFVYLLMFFVSPFIPVATQRNFKGPVTAYLVILIAQSTILILCHIALQVTIISLKLDNIFGNCSFTEQLLRHVGFVDFRNLKPLAIFEWLIPEVAVFITSLTVYLTTKRLVMQPQKDLNVLENGEGLDATTSNEVVVTTDQSTSSVPQTATKIVDNSAQEPNFDRLIKISPLFCLGALFFAGVLRPSVPGGFYYLIFLITGTYWATIKTLGRGFALVLRMVLIVLVAHLLCVVAYQTPWVQQHLDKNDLLARLIGLEPLVKSNCEDNNDIRIIIYDTENYKIDSYFNPLALCIAFYTFALTAKNISKAPVSLRREREQRPMITEPTETTPLVLSVRKKRSSTGINEEHSAQQPSGSDIHLDSLDHNVNEVTETRTSLLDQISYGFVSIGGFIYQNSYIFTNILMMAWSIVYHSWLTFVLLLWANLLWMIPNQRKAMMRSSPFIVLYAELLLIAQYIYGMNLRNDELPSKVNITGINLQQIGLDRPQEHGVQPCLPLIVKTSCLLMFWVTLRQFLKEKKEKRRESTIADIFAPLQLTVGAAGATQPDGGKRSSRFLKKAGDIFKNLLVRLWIWLLVLVIFLCAITGSKMTGFRICYMALFLFFLLVFQSSSKAWVKIMYGFWLFLIFYVMSILILTYTYQFDKFDSYWYTYLGISQTLQLDIGLERYETKDLFLHLVSPTIIVILTVIQVHYFHKRFIEALQQKPIQRTLSKHSLARFHSTENVQPPTSQTNLKQSVMEILKIFLARIKRRTKWILRHFKDVFWRFLEIHLIKLVYLTGFICSVSEVCVLHIVFVALCLMGVCSRSSVQHFISRIISLIVSIIVLTKMIYQVKYLDHKKFDSTCGDSNKTVNDADWFGITKASEENGGLMGLLRPYIIYMIMVTLHAVVTLRQMQMRTLLGTINQPQPRVLFPKITRADAEKNLNKMIKYLFNYGFYKFGLEVSLIWLVSTITYRQDIVAVLYAFWLVGFLMLKRRQIGRIWIVFEWFIGTAIVVEYLLLVSLPPHLCIVYPWENTYYAASIQRWAMLPGSMNINHVPKLIFDFILLMIINRQRRIFSIEKRLSDTEVTNYPGGSNRSVIKDIAKLGQVPFQNPTRDFLSSVRNYLDIFQNIVLSGFYWITLGVVFVGGTNIFDLLALGYLIGAFVFLWEGSDFYLRPINTIIRRWKWLIAYNVSNIIIKTLLQIAGCIFMTELRTYTCWLVHVLGISCAARPRPLIVQLAESDENPNKCPQTTTEVLLVWDAICFAFLILQFRIFKSHYFCHMIIDTRANNLLASRGAEIIEDLRQKQIEHRKEHDEEVLLKIKRKMEKIRATQQKMLRPIDKPTHFDAELNIAEEGTKVAPLARHCSFSSCHDEDTVSCNSSCNSDDSSSGSTKEDEEQLLGDAEPTGMSRLPHSIRVEYADIASTDMQTDYGDVPSVSDVAADHALALQLHTVVHLELPDGDTRTPGQQPLTPSSEMLTLPFDGFLETNRLSSGSARTSDIIIAPLREDTEIETESGEVSVPSAHHTLQPTLMPLMQNLMPPSSPGITTVSLNVNLSGGSSVISSNITASGEARHRRQSSVNAVSWNETVSVQCMPNDSIGSAEVSEDVPVTLRQKSLHRRHLSVGNANYSMDDVKATDERRRRSSNVSWARTETLMRSAARPHSWGPVEQGNPVPASRPTKREEPKLHGEAIRAGDYYMFEDVDEKFELDIIDDHKDFLDEQEQLTESEKKITRRKTLFDVWKDIQSAEYRRRLYMRQRSYASAPGSRFGFDTIEDEDILGDDTIEITWDNEGGGVRTSTHSEPLMLLRRVKSESLGSKRKESSTSDKAKEFEKEKLEKLSDGVRPADELDEGATEDLAQIEADILAKRAEDEELTSNPIVRLLEGFLVSIIIRLNRFSRNYRYVNKILAEEKRALKENTNLSRIGRPGAASMFNAFRKNIESSEHEDATSRRTSSVVNAQINADASSQNDITQLTAITPTEPNMPSSQLQSQQDSIQEQNLQDQSQHLDHDIIEMPLDSVDAGSDQNSSSSLNKPANKYSFDDAEFAARDHHIIVEVMISFWYAILSNTDLICYIVIFINQVCNASIISLPLPIMVFLWGTLSLPRPTKTFWVTLIAYTQAIVLIKCIFQYKLIWLHYNELPNKPLGWAKILGVEERANYANIDLLVLLVLFLHRFILKSHGLWKTKYSWHNDEDSKAIEGPEGENVETQPPVKTTFLTSSDEIEDWRDAQSNPELIEEAKRKDGPDSKLTKRDDEGTDRDREKGGIDQDDRLNDASDKYIAGLQRLKRAKYLSSLRKFFHNLIHRPRLTDDVYALMFLCDFINFFVLLFGFSAFSSRQTESDDGGVQAYLAENKVPIPFLIMLLIQFILIVIDRALYLRKALIPKIVFHFLSVIGIHIWMFFVVPAVTESSFYKLAPPIIFYIFKCFYLLLSSYQIKCGYPRRILGNFLTKSFSIANMIMLKIFMVIPFLYELRTILDWVCTDTTMTLFDWLKMEDIFTNVFFIRCSRQMEQDFPAIRAERKALQSKLILGGFIIMLIVILIWGPLCLFALGKTVGQSNVPYEVRVSIRIGPYDPIYDTNNRESIYNFNESMLNDMTNAYEKDREALAFLSGYDATDVAAVKLAGNAPSLWQISPPDRERLLADLESGKVLTARFTYSLTRKPPAKGLLDTVGSETTLDINSTFAGRKNMIDMLKGSNSTGEVVIMPDLVPKFLKLSNTGDLTDVTTLLPQKNSRYRPLVLTIRGSQISSDLWWEIRDFCNDSDHKDVFSKLPLVDCNSGIVMYTFNDKKFPSTFSLLTAGGIFGLYTTFVLVASRFIKGFMGGQSKNIMFEDLPYVDRVLQLCLDIYLVREALEFALEEDLFAKLIFLYRSPETLIKWTRPKEELRDDETDSESVPSRSSMRRVVERGEQR